MILFSLSLIRLRNFNFHVLQFSPENMTHLKNKLVAGAVDAELGPSVVTVKST